MKKVKYVDVEVEVHDEKPPEYDERTVEKDRDLVKQFGGFTDISDGKDIDVPDVDDPDHEGPLDVEQDARIHGELKTDSNPEGR